MKKINIRIWLSGLAMAAGLLWAGSAFAIGAELPFYAAANTQPNVLIVPDTSTSLRWGIDGSNNPPTGQRRIDILKRVLAGQDTTPVLYTASDGSTYQAFIGVMGGEFSVYQDLLKGDTAHPAGYLLNVLLVHEVPSAPGTYELTSTDYYRINFSTEQFYYVFEDYRDLLFGNTVTKANVEAAKYPLDEILRDYNVDAAMEGSTVDLLNDGLTVIIGNYKKQLMTPSASGTNMGTQYTEHYTDTLDKDIIKVYLVTNCFKVGSHWRSCYRPLLSADPKATDTFVIMGNTTDYININKCVTDLFGNCLSPTIYINPETRAARTTIKKFIAEYNDLNHVTNINAYLPNFDSANAYRNLCGDGTITSVVGTATCPADGRAVNRTINKVVASTTTGSVKMIYNADEIASIITGRLPNVGEVDAMLDGDTSKEFIKNTSIGTQRRIDTQVRIGLHYPTTSMTLNGSCLSSHDLCGFFSDNNGRFTGLPYEAMKVDHPGIIDNFDVRWGLMISVSGGGGQNTDFPQPGNPNTRGGNLIFNYSNTVADKVHLKEIIRQKDLDGDGNIYVVQDDFNNPSGTAVMQWFLRDIFSYNYSCWFGSADPEGLTCEFNHSGAVGYDPTPSMFHIWDWERYGMQDFNGHVLLNDPYFYYKCRRNYVIIVTDGAQRGGGGNVGTQLESSVNYMKNFPNPSARIGTYALGNWEPTKVFFIAFAMIERGGVNVGALQMLNDIAWWSYISSWPGDEDWRHALTANSEEELALALNTIMNNIMQGSFTRSTPAINTTLTAVVAGYFDVIPAADYLWRGHLVYINLVSMTEGSTTLTAELDAATLLNNRTSAREVFTSRVVSGAWNKLAFSTGQDNVLSSMLFPNYTTPPTGYKPESGGALTLTDVDNLINFINSASGAAFGDTAHTPRTWRLGGIYHSTPMPMGPPPQDALPNVPRYQKYAADYAGAPEMAYVGALDGMLHAFFFMDPDDTGSRSVLEEGFAYVPNYLLQFLFPLRQGQQNVYVDGDPNVGVMDVRWPAADPLPPDNGRICDITVTPNRCWQTILYSGLRDGGPAYFSLNITDVSTTLGSVSSNVQPRWEFTDPEGGGAGARSSFLGATWSQPFVDEALYKPGSDPLDTRLILVFGGGKKMPNSNKPYEGSWLYILDADEGNILRTLLVPSYDQHCDVTGQSPNMLLAGATNQTGIPWHMADCDTVDNMNSVPGDVLIKDIDLDEFPDWIYFGDMQGRMWKANIHSWDPAQWGICMFFDTADNGYEDVTAVTTNCNGDLTGYDTGVQPTCATKVRRPIMYRPAMALSPDGNGYLIYFGTGHIEDKAESTDTTNINYIFAVKDSDTIGGCHYGTLWGGSVSLNSNTPSAATGGWPIKLNPGEKLISAPQIVNPNRFQTEISFQTYDPFKGVDVCKPGVTSLWQVDYNSGQGALCTLSTCTTTTGWARNKPSPGLGGRSLVLGDITFTPNISSQVGSTATGTLDVKPQNLLNGYYYWWIK